MSFNFSYWEKETFVRSCDCLVIGGGLVGINTAISLKEANEKLDVLLVEKGGFPLGASTRNAGFACFGSVTELLDDYNSSTESDIMNLLLRRLEGLRFLRKRLGDKNLDYKAVGGYEVFDKDEEVEQRYGADIGRLNDVVHRYTGLKEAFQISEGDFGFDGFAPLSIYNQYEGCLHPGKMMESLYKQAQSLGVRFIMGTKVDSIHGDGYISLGHERIKASKIAVCTNGFSNDLIHDIDLKPARNQVFVTERIPDLKINSCFHYNKGYVYFRNIDDRILIGGGRNIALQEETTSNFEITTKIKSNLMDILVDKIGLSPSTKIDFEWSGIMGIGTVKAPILEKQGDSIIFALRLGGMGVALGSKLGHDAAKLMLEGTTE